MNITQSTQSPESEESPNHTNQSSDTGITMNIGILGASIYEPIH